ncbi:hypothetical protein AVEN_118110-1 [Araneus ventricosus]|uniref:Uncharacterized protein n=1 Tax=Araneus ventricosus TaxID=182803 RepID=A0A4Y2QBM2_ARAVE|nr:hypothetical protein AVEN_118110-1 [Araneus ventricosus]
MLVNVETLRKKFAVKRYQNSRQPGRLTFPKQDSSSTRPYRSREAAAGMHGPDESPGFAKARKCLEAILAFCESTPDMCMR